MMMDVIYGDIKTLVDSILIKFFPTTNSIVADENLSDFDVSWINPETSIRCWL